MDKVTSIAITYFPSQDFSEKYSKRSIKIKDGEFGKWQILRKILPFYLTTKKKHRVSTKMMIG